MGSVWCHDWRNMGAVIWDDKYEDNTPRTRRCTVSHFYLHFAGPIPSENLYICKYIVFNPQVHGIRCILPPKEWLLAVIWSCTIHCISQNTYAPTMSHHYPARRKNEYSMRRMTRTPSIASSFVWCLPCLISFAWEVCHHPTVQHHLSQILSYDAQNSDVSRY